MRAYIFNIHTLRVGPDSSSVPDMRFIREQVKVYAYGKEAAQQWAIDMYGQHEVFGKLHVEYVGSYAA